MLSHVLYFQLYGVALLSHHDGHGRNHRGCDGLQGALLGELATTLIAAHENPKEHDRAVHAQADMHRVEERGNGASSTASGEAAGDDQRDQFDEHVISRLAVVNQRLRQRHGDATIDEASLQIGGYLGEGSYGSVHLCKTPDGSPYVMKRVRMQKQKSIQEIDTIVDEVGNHARLFHSHIVRLHSVFMSRGNGGHGCDPTDGGRVLSIVLEFAAGGTLHDRVEDARRSSGKRLSTRLVEVWLGQLSSALSYMHKKKVLHRDLSSPNILMRDNGDLLIGDLGVSKKTGASTITLADASGARLPTTPLRLQSARRSTCRPK